jgi:hypothetical protein
MRNKYAEIIKGLPGGPNEYPNFPLDWGYSNLGYKRNSPDRNNPFNIIPSGRITMKDVDFPITGIDDLGNEKLMFPGNEYEFPGSEVFELPHKEHPSLEWEGRPLISNNGFEGFEGGFHSKYLDMHAAYRKPLQMIGDGHLSLTGHLTTGPNEFSFTPSVHIGGHGPEFGVNIGFKHRFQPGGETWGIGDSDMLNFYYNYLDSDKYKERLKSSGYANPQEIADKRQGSHFNTRIHYKDEQPGMWNSFMDLLSGDLTNMGGSAYIPGDKMGTITPGDILVYKGQAELEGTTPGDIERHERGHAMVQDGELNEYDQRQFSERELESSRNKGYRGGKKIPIGNQQLEESYADMTGLRYTIFDELGIDATKDITDEDMSKIQTLIKDSKYKSAKRLFDAYSPEDIKWMLNNIASNQSVSSDQMQMAQDGDEVEDPQDFLSRSDYNAQKLAEGIAKNQELKSAYDSELSNYNTYLSEKEKYDAANSGYTSSLDAYNYQRSNPTMYPTRFGGIGWRSGLDKDFQDTSKFRQLDEQELTQFNELQKSQIDRNNKIGAGSEDFQKQFFIPSTSTYVPVDSKDSYRSQFSGSIYKNLEKPTAPGAVPTEVIKPNEPSYVDTSQYITPEISKLPIIPAGTLSSTPATQGIIGDYEEDELEAPTYNSWEGSRPQRFMGAKNPLRGGRRLSAGLTQKLSGYDSDAMDAEIEAAENEGRRINFEGLGKGSASSGKFQKQYNQEYDAYEAALKQREDDQNYAKAFSQNMLNRFTGTNDDLVKNQDGDEINFYSPEPIDNTYVDQSILNNQLAPFRSFAHLTYEEQMALIKKQKIEAAMRLLRRDNANNSNDVMYDFNSQNVPVIFQDGDEVTGVNPGSGYDTDHKIQYVDTDKNFNTGFKTQDKMLKEAMETYKQSMLSQSGATAHAPSSGGIPGGGIGGDGGDRPPREFTRWEQKHGDWDGSTWVPDERFKGIKGAIDNIGTRREARKDFRSKHPKDERRRFDKWNKAANIFRKKDDRIRNNPKAFREYHPRVATNQEGTNLRHWSNLWQGERDLSQFQDFNFFKSNKIKQDGGENEQYNNAYLNDLYISSDDLTYLNHEGALDLNSLPKEKWDQIVRTGWTNGTRESMSYKEIADLNDGMIPWDNLNEADKQYSNQYYCDPSKGCLASSFDAYDQVVGQRYPSTDFLSEAKLKNEMNLQSLQGYTAEQRADGTTIFKDPNGNQVSDRTKQWIESIPYFQSQSKSSGYDFTADSWDIHGVLVDQGGKNIFTGGSDYNYDTDEYLNQDTLADFSTLSDSEKQALYSQMTPGTIVGFGKYNLGENQKYGLTGSGHSTQVVGYAEDGVPIIYDYGKYTRIDDPSLYGVESISNITIPKQQLGKNLEWAKSKGYYKQEGPSDLNFDISPLYEEGDEDELKPFYNALAKKKRRLMNDLNIKPEDYDMMAKTLIGITMAETTGGAGAQHNIESIIPGTPFQESAGLTQLMWSNIEDDPKLKRVAAKYGITEISDLKDPEKSAIASMIYGHRNLQSAKKNWEEGKGQQGKRTYYPADSWKQETKQLLGKSSTYDGYKFKTDEGPEVDFFTGNKYIGLGWDKSIEDIQAQFDEIAPGKYTVREEDGNYVVDKVTKGNSELSPEQMFIYNWNSPNVLKSGDAQGGSGYVRSVLEQMDKFQIGGEVVPEDVQAMKDSLEQELQNLKGFKMNPAQQLKLSQQLHDTYNENVPRRFKVGGPKLSKELQLYKDYIIGNDDSEKARKNYDKLNRVYYREAKVKNMKPANYIMSTMIS